MREREREKYDKHMLALFLSLLSLFMCSNALNTTVDLDNSTLIYGVPLSAYDCAPEADRSYLASSGEALMINWDGVHSLVDFIMSTQENNTDTYKRNDKRTEILNSVLVGIGADQAINYLDPDHVVQTEMCQGGYSRDRYDTITWRFNLSSLACNIREFYFTYASPVIDNASRLALVAYSMASDMIRGSTRTKCNGAAKWYTLTGTDGKPMTVLVGITPWMTGKHCDTTVSYPMLEEAMDSMLHEAEGTHLSSWCSRFDNGGTWHADVRFLIWVDTYLCSQNLWDVPCAD